MYSRIGEFIRIFINTFRKINNFITFFIFLLMSFYFLPIPFILLKNEKLNNRKKRCAVLVRISRPGQSEYSIPYQLEKLRKFSIKKGFEIITEVIEEESGKNLARDGVWEIISLAKKGAIDYVLVVEIDRLGRNAISTITVAGLLFMMGVRIIAVEKEEEYDLNDFKDIFNLVIESVTAQEETRKLSNRTKHGRITKFLNRKWLKNKIDFGYKKAGEWIVIDEGKRYIIIDIFQTYIRTKNYRKVSKEIQKKHNIELKDYQIRKILRNPIYIGKPMYGGVTLEDDSLAIIDNEIFEKVQRIINSKRIKRKIKSKHVNEFVEKLVEEFGFFNVKRIIPVLAYVCKSCGVPLVKNGYKIVEGRKIQRYACPSCKRDTIDPVWKHRNKLRNVVYFLCACFSLENYTVKKLKNGNYLYTCNVCKHSFETNEPPNPFLRYIRQQQRKNRKRSDRAFIFKRNGCTQATIEKYLSS